MRTSVIAANWVRIAALAFLMVAGQASAADNAARGTTPSVVDQLVGGWRLVSRVTRSPDGKIVVDPGLSATPNGVLIYDAAGHVAAQLSRRGRTLGMLAEECRDAERIKGTADTAQTVLGYDAYFGTYKVDAKEDIVTHHLESALLPGDIGKLITRRFSLSGDTLTISFDTAAWRPPLRAVCCL